MHVWPTVRDFADWILFVQRRNSACFIDWFGDEFRGNLRRISIHCFKVADPRRTVLGREVSNFCIFVPLEETLAFDFQVPNLGEEVVGVGLELLGILQRLLLGVKVLLPVLRALPLGRSIPTDSKIYGG